MVNTWSHELHNWIITWFYTLELKCIVWQCASYFWSLNGVLKFCKFCNVFVICRKVRAVLMTKILWFWLFSVLSHQSWIKIFFLSLDRTLSHGLKVPWFRLVCTSVEFVLSIVIKSVVNYIICTNVEFVLSIVIKWFKF
jgi:hypothetical protein